MASRSAVVKTLIVLAIKLGLAGVIFWLLVRNLDVQETLDSVRALPASAWAIILVIPLVQAFMLGQRWRMISETFGHAMVWTSSTLAMLISFFFSQGLPASIGGDAFRIWFQTRGGVPVSTATKTVFVDRLVGFFTLVGLTAISLLLLVDRTAEREVLISLSILALALLVAMGAAILLFRARVLRTVSRENRSGVASFALRVYNWLLGSMDFVALITFGRAAAILSLAVIVHLLTIGLIFVAARNNADVTFLDCFAAVTPALLISYLPISIAGWGVREAAVVAGFSLIGVPIEVSLPVSLLVGLSVFFVSLLGGAAWVWGGFKSAYARSLANRSA